MHAVHIVYESFGLSTTKKVRTDYVLNALLHCSSQAGGLQVSIVLYPPSLERTKCWGKCNSPGAGYNIYTYVRMEIFNFGSFSLAILEKMHFLCFLG